MCWHQNMIYENIKVSQVFIGFSFRPPREIPRHNQRPTRSVWQDSVRSGGSLVSSGGGSDGVWRDLMGTGLALGECVRFWFDLVESRAGP